MINNTRHFLRKREIRRCLQFCDNDRERINILVNLVYKQENEIAQLQKEITQLVNTLPPPPKDSFKPTEKELIEKRLFDLCVQVPF